MTDDPQTTGFGGELDRQRAQIMRRVRHAADDWAAAMRAHKLAPPDLGFAQRLRDLADAATNEQVAWEYANSVGLQWRPVPGAQGAAPPYELRPGTGRRGPSALWERFDQSVAGLNRAIGQSDPAAVADAFGELAEVTGALADAVQQDDRTALSAARERGVA